MHNASIDYYDVGLHHVLQSGGVHTLPEVMTLDDVARHCNVPLLWLMQLCCADALPGTIFVGTHTWRCRREVLMDWLKEHANEQRFRMAWTQRSYPPHSTPQYTNQHRSRRSPLSH